MKMMYSLFFFTIQKITFTFSASKPFYSMNSFLPFVLNVLKDMNGILFKIYEYKIIKSCEKNNFYACFNLSCGADLAQADNPFISFNTFRTNGAEEIQKKKRVFQSTWNVFLMGILFVTSFSTSLVALKNNQEQFLQAVQLQQDKKYKDALAVYETINPKGRAVLYNMGLSYYGLGQFPYALVYLQRAQLNAPSSEYALIARQLTVIKKQLGQPSIASFWYTAIARWVSGISLLLLQLIFLFLWYLLWWCFGYIQKNRRRRLLFTLWVIVFALSSVGLFVKASLQRYTGGVVIEKEVSLRAGPQKEYDVVGTVASADQITIIKKVDNWYLVKAGSSRGWVPGNAVIVINE